MKLDAGEARSRTRPFSSSGLGHAARAAPSSTTSAPALGSGFIVTPPPMRVPLNGPGQIALTSTPCGASSSAACADDVDHGGLARRVPVAATGSGLRPAFEDMTTIRPGALRRITAEACFMVKRTPLRLTPSTRSQSERSTVSIRCPPSWAGAGHRGDARVRDDDVDPALGRDDVGDERLDPGLVADVDDEGRTVAPARRRAPPCERARSSASMSASVTCAPQSASTSAIAKPSPLAAPVTTARVPRTSKSRSWTLVTGPGRPGP